MVQMEGGEETWKRNRTQVVYVPSQPSDLRNHLMYGPGNPFIASKHNAVSSTSTGPFTFRHGVSHQHD